MWKITGYLNAAYTNPEGITVQPKKTLYARSNFTFRFKLLYLRVLFDHVEIAKESGK